MGNGTNPDGEPAGRADTREPVTPDGAVPPPPAQAAAEALRGVGGWLLFLCVLLTILGPAFTVLTSAVALREIPWSALDQVPRLGLLLRVELVIELWLVVYSIIAGLSLWRVRSGAVQRAKGFLRWLLVARAVEIGLPFVMDLPSAVVSAMAAESGKEFIKALIFFGIWHTYLNKSVRVRATFGSPARSSRSSS